MARFTKINDAFTCISCLEEVLPLRNGSCRNHCPFCLSSLHVDLFPGDRANPCRGEMKAVSYRLESGKKGLRIQFKCQKCGELTWNKSALDDPEQPDRYEIILKLRSFQETEN